MFTQRKCQNKVSVFLLSVFISYQVQMHPALGDDYEIQSETLFYGQLNVIL